MQYSAYSNIENDSWSYHPGYLAEQIQDAGLWDNFDAIYLLGRIREKAEYLIELKGSGNDGVIAGGNVEQDNEFGCYSDGYGYIDSNFNPSVDAVSFLQDSAGIGFFIVDDTKYNPGFIGGSDNTGWINNLMARHVNGSLGLSLNNKTTTYKVLVDRKGFYIVNRDGATVEVLENGVSRGLSVAASTGIPNLNIYLLLTNFLGTPVTTPAYPGRLGLYFIGGKWTAPQIATLNTLFTNYFTRIGTTIPTLIREYDKFTIEKLQYQILYQCDNYILARDIGILRFSDDYGVTWTTYNFADWDVIGNAFIWDNGNVNFFTHDTMYFSDDGLATVSVVTVFEEDGITPMTFHIPVNASFPGDYFRTTFFPPKMYDGGNEIRLFGNYGNVSYGATPANIYYLWNNGANCKRIYQFGVNPHRRDDGTANGGDVGNDLGDPLNPDWVRHTHCIVQVPGEMIFYYCSGDHLFIDGNEAKWFTIEFTGGAWVFTKIIDHPITDRTMSTGINIEDGYIYFTSDDYTGLDMGVFKCLIEDITDFTKQTKLVDYGTSVVGLVLEGLTLLNATAFLDVAEINPIALSIDGGINWDLYNLDVPSNNTFFYVQRTWVNKRFILNPYDQAGEYGTDKIFNSVIFTLK